MKKSKYLLVILWMIVIFLLSNQNGYISSNESSGIIYFVIDKIYSLFNISKININEVVNLLHNPLRELMHMAEYFILALLLLNATSKKYLITFVICFIFSITDELHQLFVPFRTFQLMDITIDNLGSLLIITFSKISFNKNKNFTKIS